jgi:hypothetical protein
LIVFACLTSVPEDSEMEVEVEFEEDGERSGRE